MQTLLDLNLDFHVRLNLHVMWIAFTHEKQPYKYWPVGDSPQLWWIVIAKDGLECKDTKSDTRKKINMFVQELATMKPFMFIIEDIYRLFLVNIERSSRAWQFLRDFARS